MATIKNTLKKCDVNKHDSYLALLQIRNTPKKTGPSPSQLAMSRKLRTILLVAT